MRFRYELPATLRKKVASLHEFASGGTQVTVQLSDGREFQKVLISNSTWIIAIRGYTDLPFAPSEISDVFQTTEDEHPSECGGWHYWDSWRSE
jgi:hypothetical protein